MANVWLILGGSLSLQMMLSNLPTHLHTSHNRLLTFILPSGEAGLPWHYFPELAMTLLLFNRRCEGVLRQGRKAWMGRAKNGFSKKEVQSGCCILQQDLLVCSHWAETDTFVGWKSPLPQTVRTTINYLGQQQAVFLYKPRRETPCKRIWPREVLRIMAGIFLWWKLLGKRVMQPLFVHT